MACGVCGNKNITIERTQPKIDNRVKRSVKHKAVVVTRENRCPLCHGLMKPITNCVGSSNKRVMQCMNMQCRYTTR